MSSVLGQRLNKAGSAASGLFVHEALSDLDWSREFGVGGAEAKF